MDRDGLAPAALGTSTSAGMERDKLAAMVVEPKQRLLAAEGDELCISGLAVGAGRQGREHVVMVNVEPMRGSA